MLKPEWALDPTSMLLEFIMPGVLHLTLGQSKANIVNTISGANLETNYFEALNQTSRQPLDSQRLLQTQRAPPRVSEGILGAPC